MGESTGQEAWQCTVVRRKGDKESNNEIPQWWNGSPDGFGREKKLFEN
jgi:hypothetical protein